MEGEFSSSFEKINAFDCCGNDFYVRHEYRPVVIKWARVWSLHSCAVRQNKTILENVKTSVAAICTTRSVMMPNGSHEPMLCHWCPSRLR